MLRLGKDPSSALLLIFANRSIGVVDMLWKIRVFRFFQISQLIRMTVEAVALLGRPITVLVFVHQFPMLKPLVQWDDLSGVQPSQPVTKFHTHLVYLHSEKRCKAVLGDCLQRGQIRWFGQSLVYLRSRDGWFGRSRTCSLSNV